MSAPTVSVLLPVFNGASQLRASIQSVLDQTFADFELVVVDDGSTDETPAILRNIVDPRMRVLTNTTNLGLTRTLNRALAEARGEFVARQDADDLSAPGRFEKQVAFLRANLTFQLLGTSGWRLSPSGRVTGSNDLPVTHEAIRWTSVTDNPFLHTSVMFRRETIIAEFEGYDEQFLICQDFDLWSRIAARHKVGNLSARLVRMREHPSSMTRTRAAETTAEIRRILPANWMDVFPGRSFTAAERELLEAFRLQVPPEKMLELRALLDALAREFQARYLTRGDSHDFRATLCRQSLRLAYKAFAPAPRRALGEMFRALHESPGEWCRQALLWLRFLPQRRGAHR